MPLTVGDRLGHYNVTSLIGEGGMGQVYQATDTKLNRQVALKILPDAFADDPDRLARFEREAKVLASLNHPGIAQIHGLEEQDGTKALVLELVEGPTLADRIARGPIPVDEALPIAKQIAEALEAAHEQGIIHRDLKPANIKLRPDGTVKVLDFGLAKAVDTQPAGDPDQSPTLTAAATQMGVVLGTAAYMSPEQAKGKVADRRADVWAFGAVLYEMLTGRRAFAGDDVSDTLVSVLRDDPDWSRLPEDAPGRVRQAIRVCLDKDPAQRVRDLSAIRLAMEGAFETPVGAPAPVSPRRPRFWQRPLPATAVALVLVVLGGLTGWSVTRTDPTPVPTTRLSVALSDARLRTVGFPGSTLALSPDGTMLAYVGHGPGSATGVGLNIRSLAELEVRRLPGTGATSFNGMPNQPFFSPDGQWVAFFTRDEGLKKVSVDEGEPVVLLRDIDDSEIAFGTWGESDTIVFGTLEGGLRRISGDGGEPEVLTEPDREAGEVGHLFPQFLPGGREVVFGVFGPEPRIESVAVASGVRRTIVAGAGWPFYTSSGHLLFSRAGSLLAVPFDAARVEVVGPEVPLAIQVRHDVTGVPQLALTRSGTMAYVPSTGDTMNTLMWVDRHGESDTLTAASGDYLYPRLSPDGRLAAVSIGIGVTDRVHVYDLDRDALTPLTRDASAFPVWTPDGQRIAFTGQVGEQVGLYWIAADGSGEPELLIEGSWLGIAGSWTPDGRHLAFMVQDERGEDIGVLSLEDGSTTLFLDSPARENNPRFSPDGRWLAYVSDESGRREVYVRAYPSGANRTVVAQGGNPVWSRDGRELFYTTGGGIAVVSVSTDPELAIGAPAVLFAGADASENGASSVARVPSGGTGGAPNFGWGYDVAPDSDRLLMVRQTEDPLTSDEVIIVQNWHQELLERVPIP